MNMMYVNCKLGNNKKKNYNKQTKKTKKMKGSKQDILKGILFNMCTSFFNIILKYYVELYRATIRHKQTYS